MSTASRPQIPAIDLVKRGWDLTQPNLLPLATGSVDDLTLPLGDA